MKKIKLTKIIANIKLDVKYGEDLLDREVTSGYVSDLLSDVIAHAAKGDVWITSQCHPNIIAVAVLKEIPCIIIVNNRVPEQETLEKARAENLPVMTTDLPAFEISGRLYAMGIRGMAE